MGILYAFISLLLLGGANTIQEYIADSTDTTSTFVRQYVFLVIVASIAVYVFDSFVLTFTSFFEYLGLFLLGIIGYGGIWSLIKGLQLFDVTPVFLIAYTYVIVGYILNIFFVGSEELLSIYKLIRGGLFFLSIMTFLSAHKSKNSLQSKYITWGLLYPAITALCRALFFSGINRYIKSSLLTPLQSVFFTEGIIAVIAFGVYCLQNTPKKLIKNISAKSLLASLCRALCAFLGGVAGYLAYSLIPANTVNTIRLFGIICTTILAWVFLQEKISRQQLIPILLATITLIGFTLSP